MTMTSDQRQATVGKIMATMDTPTGYNKRPDGGIDFDGGLVETPVSREDVEYLVDKAVALINSGIASADAIRRTYSCLYRQEDITFNPHAKIAALKAADK